MKILACTIDTLIGRVYPAIPCEDDDMFYDIFFTPSHIFLDEAAYCCITKLPVLFGFCCHITMLGDHMQLPPVCELSDKFEQSESKTFLAALWDIPSVYIADMYKSIKQLLNNYYSASLGPPSIPMIELKSTFRFGNSLTEIPGEYVYNLPLFSLCADDTDLYYVNAVDSRTCNLTSPSEAEAIEQIITSYPYTGEK